MTTVRSRTQPGFVEVTAPGVTAVLEVAERHVEALTGAAEDGLVGLLDLLCSRGLHVVPSFAIVAEEDGRVRALVRGSGTVVVEGGEELAAEGRLPWRDVDLDVAEDAVVVAAAPEPQTPRGWRRPARLGGSAAAAAVPVPDVEAGDEPDATSEPDPDDEPDEDAQRDEAPEVEPEAEHAPAPQPDLTLPPPEDAPGAPPVERVPPAPSPERSIIDSVPWRRAADAGAAATSTAALPAVAASSPAAPTPPPAPVPSSASPTAEHTAVPDPEPKPEPDPEPDPEPKPDPAPPAPDATQPPDPPSEDAHAEATPDVTTARSALPRSDEDLDRPVVLAVLCPAGHHSPPHAGRCRTCQREIPPQQPAPIPRPSLGVLRISTGGVVPLDRGVLLGRSPRVNEELPPNQRPHLIRVGGADRDISRNHAEVAIEGWHVLVRDLGSTNGTTIALPGEDPVRLRPTEDHGIEPGTVITLADEVSLTYEVDG
ncbi:FHA domain-containing protein [Phycicoccus sp. CSK15P-2]|uniref:FHA domain-containing protein n=1 Tax=Phycicoccus sp. CSK15P-2 TaxID=2807627 RepID=UPI0019505B7F|nr:FHA domain-containing protein [Phycicoccus sp. CSK15P-2]MBM6403515.1 FHA domain-containing protein [Phycicoccus sp. CSK15P-2]